MNAFLYGAFLQWKLDIRSKSLLISCYAVPLVFFGVMGGIFTAVMPDARDTLIQSMTVFGVTMGALIGVPPSLVEIYGSDIRKAYRANGVPLSLGLALTGVSAFVHLFLMSGILYLAAPLAFGAAVPENPGGYFIGLAAVIAASLGVAGAIGLAVKDPSKTPMVSILLFLPSILFSGILFPAELLPGAFAAAGRVFPATWGYRLLCENPPRLETALPLLAIFLLAGCVCAALLHRMKTE